jgi:hypothetical protein
MREGWKGYSNIRQIDNQKEGFTIAIKWSDKTSMCVYACMFI